MQRIWCVAAMVLLLTGAGACGQTISGFLDYESDFHFHAGSLDYTKLDVEVGLELSSPVWAGGVFLDLESDGLEDIEFFGMGSFGALDIYSYFELTDPDQGHMTPDQLLQDWDTVVRLDLTGVELWGIFSQLVTDSEGVHTVKSGAAVGAHATVGCIDFWAEARFGLRAFLTRAFWFGLDEVIRRNQACNFIRVSEDKVGCDLEFTRANIFTLFPIGCVDLGTRMGIDDHGFVDFRAWATNLQTGIDWLVIEAVEVWFELEHKHVDVHLGLGLGETTCITPFVSLIQSQQTAVDGIQLDGLQLLWEMDDVTVVASALMDDAEFFIAEDARIYPQDGGVTLAYVLLPDCIRSIDEVEFALGLEVGDEGCCAPSRFGVYAYFDSDHGKLFDFVGLRFLFNDWITDSLSWSAEGWFEYEAYQRIEFTVSYAWGEPRIVSSAEGSSCCYYLPY